MIYTVRQFAALNNISIRAMQHRIKKGKLPFGYFVKKGGREFMIYFGDNQAEQLQPYFDACVEYHKRKIHFENKLELIAELVAVYDLSITKFCKMLGV